MSVHLPSEIESSENSYTVPLKPDTASRVRDYLSKKPHYTDRVIDSIIERTDELVNEMLDNAIQAEVS